MLKSFRFMVVAGIATTSIFVGGEVFAQDNPPMPPVINFGAGGALFGIGSGVIRSKAQSILARTEVQSAIHLSLNQKNDLAEFLDPNRPQMIKITATNGDAPQITPGFGDGLDPKVEAALKPDQLKRLYEIDLQYRGPLAFSDPKVSSMFKLSPESRKAIEKISTAFGVKVGEAMRKAITEDSSENPEQDKVIRRIKMDKTILENPLSPVRRGVQAAKDEAEKGILEILTPEQKVAWTAAKGEPITFRTDTKSDWRRVLLT